MLKNMKKTGLFTIPNLLSIFRILLIPVIVWLYCTREDYYAAFALVVVSGLTDVLDGKIARKYGMITELGKILDPLADKLTQAALIICLTSRYPWMWALIALFVLKEIISAIFGYLSVRASGTVSGAMWFGKVNTVILYAAAIVLILFPEIPPMLANILILLCSASLTVAFILYLRFFIRLAHSGMESLRGVLSVQSVCKILCLCLWMLLVLFCLVYRDKITVESIVNFVPRNLWIAAAAVLVLFAFKSVCVFIYSGMLFAASGVMFPLPAALAVNLCGAAVMFLIPYLIGRKAGAGSISQLAKKHPNVKLLQGFPSESKFFLSFIARAVGILPFDVVSLYMGSVRAGFAQYMLGSLLGISVSVTTFTVMGMSVNDPASPEFLVALAVEVAVNLLALSVYILYRRRRTRKYQAE